MCPCYIMYVIQYFYEHSIHNACYAKKLILFNILEILTISILGTYNAILPYFNMFAFLLF